MLLFAAPAGAADLLMDQASDIGTDTSNFDGVLSPSDDTAQKALDTIDAATTDDIPEGATNKYLNGHNFSGDVTGAYNNTVVGNDSHRHTSATIADEWLKNSGGDVGTGNYTFTGNLTIGDGDTDNPQLNFLGTTNKYIKYDHSLDALVISAGKVIIE